MTSARRSHDNLDPGISERPLGLDDRIRLQKGVRVHGRVDVGIGSVPGRGSHRMSFAQVRAVLEHGQCDTCLLELRR
jgi:hypothetical protein